MTTENPRGLIILGLLLALGMSAAAYIFGTHAERIGASKQSIVVKGLAQKSVAADYAEWTIGLRVNAASFAEALTKMRGKRQMLDQFLSAQAFGQNALAVGVENVGPYMVEEATATGQTRMVQKGFVATQEIVATTKELPKVAAARKAALQLEAEGQPIYYSSPLYLVSNLEEIKMSLIGAATKNAQLRAEEFAKVGGVKVGVMRSASQGAFYILPAGASSDSSDYNYGGAYDKSTIDKTARVVVTIDYTIDR
jgi:uncharacterized protein